MDVAVDRVVGAHDVEVVAHLPLAEDERALDEDGKKVGEHVGVGGARGLRGVAPQVPVALLVQRRRLVHRIGTADLPFFRYVYLDTDSGSALGAVEGVIEHELSVRTGG